MVEHTGGRLIVVEGGEGSGKSTQARRLAERIRATGREVVETHEPGGTEVGARIRTLVLDGGHLDARSEALLIAADRAQHVAEVIAPALARGAVVVCDRFVPSSLCYQGVGRELGVDAVARMNEWATGGLEPDLVLVLDVDDETAAGRIGDPTDRMEAAGVAFHGRVRGAYRELADRFGWVLIDGSGPPAEITQRCWPHVETVVERP